jgi:hypothetical protein
MIDFVKARPSAEGVILALITKYFGSPIFIFHMGRTRLYFALYTFFFSLIYVCVCMLRGTSDLPSPLSILPVSRPKLSLLCLPLTQ